MVVSGTFRSPVIQHCPRVVSAAGAGGWICTSFRVDCSWGGVRQFRGHQGLEGSYHLIPLKLTGLDLLHSWLLVDPTLFPGGSNDDDGLDSNHWNPDIPEATTPNDTVLFCGPLNVTWIDIVLVLLVRIACTSMYNRPIGAVPRCYDPLEESQQSINPLRCSSTDEPLQRHWRCQRLAHGMTISKAGSDAMPTARVTLRQCTRTFSPVRILPDRSKYEETLLRHGEACFPGHLWHIMALTMPFMPSFLEAHLCAQPPHLNWTKTDVRCSTTQAFYHQVVRGAFQHEERAGGATCGGWQMPIPL